MARKKAARRTMGASTRKAVTEEKAEPELLFGGREGKENGATSGLLQRGCHEPASHEVAMCRQATLREPTCSGKARAAKRGLRGRACEQHTCQHGREGKRRALHKRQSARVFLQPLLRAATSVWSSSPRSPPTMWPACLRLRAKKFRYAVPVLVRPCRTFSHTAPKDIHGVPVPAALVPALKKRPWPPFSPSEATLDSTHAPVMLTLMKYVSAQASPTRRASASTARSASDRFARKGTRRRTWTPGLITSKCSPCTLTKCGSPVADKTPGAAAAAAPPTDGAASAGGMSPDGMAAPSMPDGGSITDGGIIAAGMLPDGGIIAAGMPSDGGIIAAGMPSDGGIIAAGMPSDGGIIAAGMPSDGGIMAHGGVRAVPFDGGMAGGVSWPERRGRRPWPAWCCTSSDTSILVCIMNTSGYPILPHSWSSQVPVVTLISAERVIVAHIENAAACNATYLALHGVAQVID
ncbi:unnamed protein product [Prorocentrum cordatum]|uniref:Uncharacterized protein n=1 Tax=Prorocentrum cordatum TaxID=2364126 RepID=A0ABN9U482_9DINO|nr:unnamed protein product [Polarella glacialis]